MDFDPILVESLSDEEKQSVLINYLDEFNHRLTELERLRAANLDAERDTGAAGFRLDEAALRKLDSNLKKNTAFVKKLKNLTESQRPSLVKDFQGLNLSKYVEEIASSLVDVKLKLSDVPTAVEVASLTHQRYGEFAELMLELWKKVLPRKKTDKIVNASKLRVDLRFYADLNAVGIFPEKDGLNLLGGCIAFLTNTDKEGHVNLPTICTFLKYCGHDYCGTLPETIRRLAAAAQSTPAPVEWPQSSLLTPDKQKKLADLFMEYHKTVETRLVKQADTVKKLQKKNRHQYLTKGEVFKDAEQALIDAKAVFTKLHGSAVVLADLLNVPLPPSLPSKDDQDSDDDRAEMNMIVTGGGVGVFNVDDLLKEGGLWEDEDQRQFYESIPELRVILPSILYKDSETAQLKQIEEKVTGEGAEDEEEEDEDVKRLLVETDAAAAAATGDNSENKEVDDADEENQFEEKDDSHPQLSSDLPKKEPASAAQEKEEEPSSSSTAVEDPQFKSTTDNNNKDSTTGDVKGKKDSNKAQQSSTSSAAILASLEADNLDDRDRPELGGEDEDEDGSVVSGSTMKIMMDAFVNTLPTLVNRDMIDNAATDFVTNLNTRPNRKKLLREIYLVQRTRLDLLPFYSRLVAILKPVMPDLGTQLVDWLSNDFRRHIRKKDQIKIETKIKTSRFIGELVKFKIFPKSEALFCLKNALFDFRHHAIDMVCNLLESCGYYLFHHADSHQKTKILLELLMRKRNTLMSNDQRYLLMIDNAFYSTNPPIVARVERKKRPPLHEYVRRLIYKDLSRGTVDKVLKHLRKLPWKQSTESKGEEDPAASRGISSKCSHENEVPEILYALKCLSSPWQIKYSCIQWLASVLAGLMWYHDWIGYRVVDTVLEDIRFGMEINHPRLNQRRLSTVRYLGEMYNFRVIDSSMIFNVLYSLILFGVSYDPQTPSGFDPPEHLFRIRLVCALLDTCGEYFVSGSSGRKLDCFLMYLQRYYWLKRSADIWSSSPTEHQERPFPIVIRDLMTETLEKMRPQTKPLASLEECEEAVRDLEESFRRKVEAALSQHSSGNNNAEENGRMNGEDYGHHQMQPLSTIQEGDEDDDEMDFDNGDNNDKTRQRNNKGRQDNLDWEGTQEEDGAEDDGGGGGFGSESEEEMMNAAVKVHRSTSDHQEVNPEDDDFLAAFDKLMADSITQRVSEAPSVPQPDISVPANVRAKIGRRTQFEDDSEEEPDYNNHQTNNDNNNADEYAEDEDDDDYEDDIDVDDDDEEEEEELDDDDDDDDLDEDDEDRHITSMAGPLHQHQQQQQQQQRNSRANINDGKRDGGTNAEKEGSAAPAVPATTKGPGTIRFALLTRGKGGKPSAKSLKVPADSEFVQIWRDKEAADRAEKERVKQLTLNINRRMEQEEIDQEEREIRGLSTIDPHGTKRFEGRRNKFQHPKESCGMLITYFRMKNDLYTSENRAVA